MLRKRIMAGEVIAGTWVQTGSCVAAEIMAGFGFDFIAADMEHTDINEDVFSSFARAIEGRAGVMARVRENDTLAVRRVLDCGAEGVIVPLVNNRVDAERAVAAAKYPPAGIRGFAFVRANGWGESFKEYTEGANENTAVIVMIETSEAVENIDEILSVEGVDGILIGPYDISGSYGVAGDTGHELVVRAKERVLKACKTHGKAAGQHIVIPTEENVAEAVSQGYTFLALGMDTVFIAEGAKRAIAMTKGKK